MNNRWFFLLALFLVVGFFVLFEFGVFQSFVGVNPDRGSVYFRDGVEGDSVSFSVEFVNNKEGILGGDEFSLAKFVFTDLNQQVYDWTSWVSDVYNYGTGRCIGHSSISKKGDCCRAYGFARDYKDRFDGVGYSPSCYVLSNVNADLTGLIVGGNGVSLGYDGGVWTSEDLSSIINSYCLLNRDQNYRCLVPVVLSNGRADGSGVNVGFDYVLSDSSVVVDIPPVDDDGDQYFYDGDDYVVPEKKAGELLGIPIVFWGVLFFIIIAGLIALLGTKNKKRR